MGVGCVAARFVCERYDDGTSGLKPLTMLWVLISVDELSDDDAMAWESVLLTVDVEDSRWLGAAMVGMGVATVRSGSNAGAGADGVGFVAVGV